MEIIDINLQGNQHILANKRNDKFRGCLLGGAVGDALGYAVEFWDEEEILAYYGECGITEYELTDGKALISDDTQMTLFTAEAILKAAVSGEGLENYTAFVSESYKEWLITQCSRQPSPENKNKECLLSLPELYSRRAPGNTCLDAIARGANGTMENPINDSKGCGGIMRVAPIGLLYDSSGFLSNQADLLGAAAAALTHGHELGYIPAAALVHMVRLLAHNDEMSMLDAVLDTKENLQRLFAGKAHLGEMTNLIDKAIFLARQDLNDRDAIRELGEGWVAEETLAIALYCCLKYSDDFEKAIIASVNHSGDSDSTGAVTGNILGAYLGLSAIPKKYQKNLELRRVILRVADALYRRCSDNDKIH